MWNNLKVGEKAEIIKLAVKSGIKDLNTIRKIYNNNIVRPVSTVVPSTNIYSSSLIKEESLPKINKDNIQRQSKLADSIGRGYKEGGHLYKGDNPEGQQMSYKDKSIVREAIKQALIDNNREESLYRKAQGSPYGLLYDAVNLGLYLAAPATGGTTLIPAGIMSAAQGGLAVDDAIKNGINLNNSIDIATAITGTKLFGDGVKMAAKPIMKTVGKTTKRIRNAPKYLPRNEKIPIQTSFGILDIGKSKPAYWQYMLEDPKYIPYGTLLYSNDFLNAEQVINDLVDISRNTQDKRDSRADGGSLWDPNNILLKYQNNENTNNTPAPIDHEELRRRQAWTESRGDNFAKSKKGAVGLYQITPVALKEYTDSTGNIGDLTDPVYSKEVRDWFMNRLTKSSYINNPALSDSMKVARQYYAYNAGLGNLKKAIDKAKSAGIDTDNDWAWMDYGYTEPKNYTNFIVRNIDSGGNRTNKEYNKNKNKIK